MMMKRNDEEEEEGGRGSGKVAARCMCVDECVRVYVCWSDMTWG